MASNAEISNPFKAFRRWGFYSANVIVPNLASNEKNRHPDALFSGSSDP